MVSWRSPTTRQNRSDSPALHVSQSAALARGGVFFNDLVRFNVGAEAVLAVGAREVEGEADSHPNELP
jgi:hypothetical protein